MARQVKQDILWKFLQYYYSFTDSVNQIWHALIHLIHHPELCSEILHRLHNAVSIPAPPNIHHIYV